MGRPKKAIKTPTSITKQSKGPVVFEHEQLRDALFFIQDMLERSMIPYMVLGDLALQLFETEDPLLFADKIELGVQKKHLTESGVSMFRGLVPSAKIANNKIFYIHTNGVPVHIHIVEDKEYFKYPDVRFYYQTQFYVPNPFMRYWDDRSKDD